MWDLLAVFAIFALLGIILELIRASIPRILQANPRTRRANQEFGASEADLQAANAELHAMTARRDEANQTVNTLNKRIAKLKEEVDEVQPNRPVIAREIGKPLRSSALFEAHVSNRYFRFANRPPMAEKLNPVWARAVLIQVWAASRIEARRLIERNFSNDLGYDIDWGAAFAEAKPETPVPEEG